MEMESTTSRLGRWEKKTDVEGYKGECHLEFTGNKIMNGPPASPLVYYFQIQKEGKYTLALRARKRLETERDDLSNDCYVAVSGNYTSGGDAPLNILKEDTKMFGGNPDSWGWALKLDSNHKKYIPIYAFKSGETYKLTISGRSKNFNLDRVFFIHESHNVKKTYSKNPAESQIINSKPAEVERVIRKLTRKDGRSVTAELRSRHGDQVETLINGRIFHIMISDLSQEDQDFIEEWQPSE